MVRLKYGLLLLLLAGPMFSQHTFDSFFKPSDSLNIQRRDAVLVSEASIVGLSLVGLNQLWYSNYDKSNFHTINDNNEWLQMDKFGHVFSSYQLGRIGADLLNWSGVTKKKQLIYGTTLGFGFLTTVEVFDGFSKEWGFSWGDIMANGVGSGLFIGQELLWNEQRITLKFSFHQTKYAPQNPDKLGKNFTEQLLKDYNGQTYWLSANLHAFFKQSHLPKWLNLAFGYGAQDMLYGTKDIDNQLLTNYNRYRQFYVSFDVNLNEIKTQSHFLKSLFSVFNVIKVPFPTLEFSKNRCVFHLFYY